MSIESQLKSYIGERYRSIREFSLACDVAYSTLDNMFKRGVMKSGMSTIIKVCNCLNISVDSLSQGKIEPLPVKQSKEDEAFQLYQKLDSEDKAIIRGEMNQMLRSEKYHTKAKDA